MSDTSDNGTAFGLQLIFAALIAMGAGYIVGFLLWAPIFVQPKNTYYFSFMHPDQHQTAIVIGGAGIILTAVSSIALLFKSGRRFLTILVGSAGILLALVIAPNQGKAARDADIATLAAVKATAEATLSFECIAGLEQPGARFRGNPCGSKHKASMLLVKVHGIAPGLTSGNLGNRLAFHCRHSGVEGQGKDEVAFAEYAPRPTEIHRTGGDAVKVPGHACILEDTAARELTVLITINRTVLNSGTFKIDSKWWASQE